MSFAIPFVKRLYHFLFPPVYDCTYWISKIVTNEPLILVHIGSHDGKTGDPFYELICQHKNWKVLFVEPVPYLFKRLQKNYPPDARFTFENAAINNGATQTFYYVQGEAIAHIPSLPKGFDQLGSFDRNNIVRHLDGKLEPYIVEAEVKGISLKTLLDKHAINRVDLLHIDTEGYDYKILSQLDLTRYSPLLILFGHINLIDAEKAQAIRYLQMKYLIFEAEADFLCISRHQHTLSNKDLQLLERTFARNGHYITG